MTGKKRVDERDSKLAMAMSIHEALVTLKGSGTVVQVRDRMAERGYDRGYSTVSEAMKELWNSGLLNRENAKGKRLAGGHCETGRTYVYSLKTDEEWLAEDFAKLGITVPEGTLRAPAMPTKETAKMPAIKPISVGEPETTLMTKEMKERQQKVKEKAKTEQKHDQRPKIVDPKPPMRDGPAVELLKNMELEQEKNKAEKTEKEPVAPPQTEIPTTGLDWMQALGQAYLGKKVVSDITGSIYGVIIGKGLVSAKNDKPVVGFPEKEMGGTWHVFIEASKCPFCGSDAKVTHLTLTGGVQRYRCTCTNENCCASGPMGKTEEEATRKFNTRVSA